MKRINLNLDDLTRDYLDQVDNRLDAIAGCSDQIINIPEAYGSGKNYLIKVSDDIDLMVSESNFNHEVNFNTPSPDMCGAMIVIEGECRMKTPHTEFKVQSGQAMLFIMSSSQCSISYPKGKIKMINFSVSTHLMAQLGGQVKNLPIINKDNEFKIMEDYFINVPVSPKLGKNVQQIYEANLSKEARRLFINAKVLEILALIYHVSKEQSAKYPSIKTSDLSSIMAAANIIEQEMSNPPSLPELARRVGINDYKLKKLFKVVFDNTVYGYLKEKRLQVASDLLIDGELSVQQVCVYVGLKHSGHFSKLFTERFGVTPINYKRKHLLNDSNS